MGRGRACAETRGVGRGACGTDAPRWWAATAARRARRAPGRRGMSSAPVRPGPCASHGAGRARAPSHPLLRQEDLPQAHLLPSLLGPTVGPHRAGIRLRRYAPRLRPARIDTGSARSPARPARYATRGPRLFRPEGGAPAPACLALDRFEDVGSGSFWSTRESGRKRAPGSRV